MNRLIIEAPALVPATTTPRRYASMIASPTGVPTRNWLSLSWLPPLMNTAVASSSRATSSGSCAAARESAWTTRMSPPARSRVKTRL